MEDDIAAYEDVIFNKMEYEICNAKIKMLLEKYRRDDEHPYQLAFGTQTIITPVEGCKPPVGPEYISIAAIPRMVIADDRYDVVAILIYVEMLQEVPQADGGILALRELVVMDASTEQPLVITAWAELATREGEQLRAIVETFPVIGFTCLKPSNHKGFSLSTTTTTFVKFKPDGEKTEMLHAWKTTNTASICAKQQQVRGAREPKKSHNPTTIRNLRAKKATGTLQDECHWLHVNIPEFDRKDVRFYLGCDRCGTGNKNELNVTYKCETCKREGVTSVPR
ncbi:replication protein A 70 kDa DNA-binding subunit B-like [Silene latifolia]|uniref:replication protein A 70 kDa DNA-binding subunit B-like n=1 Tax=Silene latifolia TaxID=37657 RepID=UPI003D7893BC